MRVAIVVCVRDEDDIIADFLDYHLTQGFAPILVHDTGSTDATLPILGGYGPPVEVSRSREDGFDQSRLVTRLAHQAYTTHRADWIFPIDADEFVWSDRPVCDLLAAVPADHQVLSLPRSNFAPVADGGQPWHQRMIYRQAASRTPFGNDLPAKIACRGRSDLVIDHGCHALCSPALPVTPAPKALSLLHFPLRTLEQARRKTVGGTARLTRTPALPAQVGRTWSAIAGLDRAGTLPGYWRAAALTPAAAGRRLADGSLVHDDRLATALLRTRSAR